MLSTFLTWHANRLNGIQRKLGLSSYQVAWIAFAKGIVLGIILGWYLAV